MKIVVRYSDRIPQGLGISKSALTSKDVQNEYMRRVFSVDLGLMVSLNVFLLC